MTSTSDYEQPYLDGSSTNCRINSTMVKESLGYHDSWSSIHVLGPAAAGIVLGNPVYAVLMAYLFETWQTVERIYDVARLGEYTNPVDSLIQDPYQGMMGAFVTWTVLRLTNETWIWGRYRILFAQVVFMVLGLSHYIVERDDINDVCVATLWGPFAVLLWFVASKGNAKPFSANLGLAMLAAWAVVCATNVTTYLLKDHVAYPLASTTMWLTVEMATCGILARRRYSLTYATVHAERAGADSADADSADAYSAGRVPTAGGFKW